MSIKIGDTFTGGGPEPAACRGANAMVKDSEPAFVRGEHVEFHLAQFTQALAGADPNAAFAIFEETGDVVINQAVGPGEGSGAAILKTNEAIAVRSGPH